MQLLCELLVRMCLDAQRFTNRENLEQERKLICIAFSDIGGEESLVFLDELEQRTLGFQVF